MQILISFLILFSSILNHDEKKPIVLVELFTSEGCSSCPPADRLLSEIVNQDSEVEVIGLSFHVDYWDYIGWRDPYASSAFSQRQRSYARKFYSNQIYTPQMVVNGKYEFVGSDRSRWNKIFNQVKEEPIDYPISLNSKEVVGNELLVEVSSSSNKNVILNIAVVERGLSQNVNRGENRGRKLSHDNVVRVFKSRQFNGASNKFSLKLPNDIKLEKANIILYAQEPSKWHLVGAKMESFNY